MGYVEPCGHTYEQLTEAWEAECPCCLQKEVIRLRSDLDKAVELLDRVAQVSDKFGSEFSDRLAAFLQSQKGGENVPNG
jgi:hypothetical protein